MDSPEGRRAFQLYDEFKLVEALPLLQKLARENPDNAVVWERLGVATLNDASTLPDAAQKKLARANARGILLKAKALGDDSNLLQVLLSDLPEDGGERSFSPRKEVEEAMNEAEADFSRGDFDKAVEGYKRALLLDPKLYEAALFTGDAYFKQQKPSLAGEWFERAAKINPDRETAYRYWGDTLMGEEKMGEARAKFIEAIAAEPYSQRAWIGLKQWAQLNGVALEMITLQDRGSPQTKEDKGALSREGQGKGEDASSAAWMAYAMTRALWRGEKFKREFPDERAYRRTSREEVEALHALVAVLTEHPKDSRLDSSLSTLIRIDKAGLLEPFVFIGRADKEIAVDYPAFRDAHRDLILSFLDKFVAPLSIRGR